MQAQAPVTLREHRHGETISSQNQGEEKAMGTHSRAEVKPHPCSQGHNGPKQQTEIGIPAPTTPSTRGVNAAPGAESRGAAGLGARRWPGNAQGGEPCPTGTPGISGEWGGQEGSGDGGEAHLHRQLPWISIKQFLCT